MNSQQADLARVRLYNSEANAKLEVAHAAREIAVKNLAEMKGQADALRAQNAELMKKSSPKP